ncbi:NCS2 family permease [Glaciibacter superstes]|uniref:NCS2 family permease n=1 Tax=Glaciibacter superstes TaxID=501023 RepID=UPI0003B70247|nr:NCS2 family permease [Glaciibacter superstes]
MTTFKETIQADDVPTRRVSRLDAYFKLTERGSTLGREFRGGLATFFAMVYIVILNPLILSGPDGSGQTLGIPQVAAATAIVAGVMTILMGLVARYPFALSAGLGVSGFISATIATTPGLTWPDIMGLIVVSGVVMFVLVLCGFREAVFKAVPSGLKIAIVVGIGLFITIIGFVNAGFVRRIPDDAHTTVPVNLGVGGVLVGWPTLVFVVGLVLLIILMVRKVRGGILIGILATTVFAVILQLFTKTPAGSAENPTGWSLVVPDLPTEFISFPDLSLFGKMDIFGAFAHIGVISASLLTFTILLSVFFDAMGTMTGLASEANLLDKDNNFVDANPVLLVDAAASAVGGFASVSANEIFVESAAGVGEGARTGIASVVTGALFIITAFFAPLSNIVPFEAVAPALVMVGFLMTTQVRNIDWADWGIAIPAFLTFALMPLTYSIANGLGAGFIAFVLIRTVQGRAKDIHPLMWLVSVAFIAFFMVGLFEQVLGV